MKIPKSNTGAAAALLILGLATSAVASAQTADPQKVDETGPARTTGQNRPQQEKNGMEMDHSGMDHSKMDHSKMNHSDTGQAETGQAKATPPTVDQSGMDHSKMNHQQMDHSKMDHSGMGHTQMSHAAGEGPQEAKSATAPARGAAPVGGAMSGMGRDMKMGPMQGGSPPPDARDPNAYAEGTTHAHLPGNEMNDEARFGRVLFDKLEYAKGDGEHGQNIDFEAWYGDDWNKLWLKAEGERSDGRLQSLRKEALWDHAIAPFWSTQLGVRHDTGGGDSRTWAAFGVRGLAPYWFDTTATAYLRSGGGMAARINVRYELLFTQRLILEPEVAANLYSKDDPARGIGSGVSDLELGLRLRYEIRRQFAPYIGVTWKRNFGDTADYARTRGERNKTAQVVAGVRLWF
jgi:copper resistance protein B